MMNNTSRGFKLVQKFRKHKAEQGLPREFLGDPNLVNTKYDVISQKNLIKHSKEKIATVYSLLADEKSKLIFKQDLLSRKKGKDLMPPDCVDGYQHQYFDADIISFVDNEIFIDAGAYDGTTTEFFMRYVGKANPKSILIEPDASVYDTMVSRMSVLELGNLEFINAALWNKSGKENFRLIPGGSSQIDKSAMEQVKTVALDDLINEATFIKMDVEGAERQALEGAKQLIQRCNPKLSIAIYHEPDDLWEVPITINKMNPNYKLYIRKYEGVPGYFLNEVVCYAIPSN